MNVITIRVVTRGAVTEEGGGYEMNWWTDEGGTSIEEAEDNRMLWEGAKDDRGNNWSFI